MSGMKRLAIGLAALVLIPCVAVLWFVWSASTLDRTRPDWRPSPQALARRMSRLFHQ